MHLFDVTSDLFVFRIDFPNLSKRRFVFIGVRPGKISDPIQRQGFGTDEVQQTVVNQNFVIVEQRRQLFRRNALKDIGFHHHLDFVVVVKRRVSHVDLSTTIDGRDEFGEIRRRGRAVGLQIVEIGFQSGDVGEVGRCVDQIAVDQRVGEFKRVDVTLLTDRVTNQRRLQINVGQLVLID